MRVVGALLFLVFAAAAAASVRAIDRRSRPADVAFAIAAPLCVIVALLGLLLVFVPDFL